MTSQNLFALTAAHVILMGTFGDDVQMTVFIAAWTDFLRRFVKSNVPQGPLLPLQFGLRAIRKHVQLLCTVERVAALACEGFLRRDHS